MYYVNRELWDEIDESARGKIISERFLTNYNCILYYVSVFIKSCFPMVIKPDNTTVYK